MIYVFIEDEGWTLVYLLLILLNHCRSDVNINQARNHLEIIQFHCIEVIKCGENERLFLTIIDVLNPKLVKIVLLIDGIECFYRFDFLKKLLWSLIEIELF